MLLFGVKYFWGGIHLIFEISTVLSNCLIASVVNLRSSNNFLEIKRAACNCVKLILIKWKAAYILPLIKDFSNSSSFLRIYLPLCGVFILFCSLGYHLQRLIISRFCNTRTVRLQIPWSYIFNITKILVMIFSLLICIWYLRIKDFINTAPSVHRYSRNNFSRRRHTILMLHWINRIPCLPFMRHHSIWRPAPHRHHSRRGYNVRIYKLRWLFKNLIQINFLAREFNISNCCHLAFKWRCSHCFFNFFDLGYLGIDSYSWGSGAWDNLSGPNDLMNICLTLPIKKQLFALSKFMFVFELFGVLRVTRV